VQTERTLVLDSGADVTPEDLPLIVEVVIAIVVSGGRRWSAWR
jgi:hypothetical protein